MATQKKDSQKGGDKTIGIVKSELQSRNEIVFAYLHGSFVESESYNDIDLALFLHPPVYKRLSESGGLSLEFVIPLEQRLERELEIPIDIQILNEAPLAFKYRVISTGRLILDGDTDLRMDFEYLSNVQYFDFRPRQKEYMKEAISFSRRNLKKK